MTEIKKTTFENINDLIKAVIWPIIALIILLLYGSEINKIVKLIPKKLESSSKISVGSLSFEIEKTAMRSGDAELADIIKNLSEGGIAKLLTLGSGSHSVMIRFDAEKAYSMPKDIDVLLELENKGLLKANEPVGEFVDFYQRLNTSQPVKFDNNFPAQKEKQSALLKENNNSQKVEISRMTKGDAERVRQFSVELSEQGKKAFEIIVHVIATQINDG